VTVTAPDPGTPTQDGSGPSGHDAHGQGTPTPGAPATSGPASADNGSPFAALAEVSVNVDPGVRPAGVVGGAAAPQRAAVEQAVIEQIVQHATLALRNGEQEFRIQLKPEFLGAMEVRVSVSDGTALVRMTAENAGTRQLIDANIAQLRQAFGTNEVRIEHVPTFAGADASWSSLNQGGYQGSGGWQGQTPWDGSSRLPEAIPFTGDPNPEPVGAVEPAHPSSLITQHSTAPGAVDVQA
jgi:flagellar hook-length control protein FliK